MVARRGGQSGSAVLFPSAGGAGLGTLASLGGDGMLNFLAVFFIPATWHLGGDPEVSTPLWFHFLGCLIIFPGTDFWRCSRHRFLALSSMVWQIWWYLVVFALPRHVFRSRRGLATGCMPPAFYKVPPGLLFPSFPLRSRLRTWSGGAEEVNGGCGEVALWKAGVRACRRWAPP